MPLSRPPRAARTARTVRTVLAAAVAATALGGLAGCGSGGDDQGAAPASGGAAGGAFPITVTGKFGTATIPKRPVRVVALSFTGTDADYALALGVRPVAMVYNPTAPGGILPWTKAALGDSRPTLLRVSGNDPVERIAALKPDLILATKDYNLESSYKQLSAFAPVVTYAKAPNTDRWQDSFRRVAKALGRVEKGEQVIRATDAAVAKAKRDHPALDGVEYTWAVGPKASTTNVINSGQDVSAQALSRLGMRIKPAVTKLPTSDIPGRAEISIENAGVLDADLMIATGSAADLRAFERNPVVRGLPAMKRGAFAPITYVPAQSLGFPSPLSLRWAVVHVVPQLAKAAAKT